MSKTNINTPLKTKAEYAYRQILRMIIERKILAGDRWSLREIGRKLNMSIIPMSQAARKLESEGLITVQSRSGIRIRELSEKEYSGLRVVREALEVQAARMVARHHARNPAKAKILRKAARNLQDCLLRGDQGKAAVLDYELHTLLVRWSECPMLIETYNRISLMSSMGTKSWKGTWKNHELSLPANHVELVEGILSGNEQRAENAVRNHIHRTDDPNGFTRRES